MWRVVVHERQPATLAEIEQHYSLDDLADANTALDVVDQLRQRMAAEQRAQQPKRNR